MELEGCGSHSPVRDGEGLSQQRRCQTECLGVRVGQVPWHRCFPEGHWDLSGHGRDGAGRVAVRQATCGGSVSRGD